MKNLMISFLTLLIFILNISHDLVSAEAYNDGASDDPVLDVEGNELKTGTNYYVTLDLSRTTKGISIYPFANKTCTSFVAEILYGQGLPVVFSNGGSEPEVIRESTDLTISFAYGMLICPAEWKVDDYDEEVGKNFVIAAASDEDGTSTKNRFQIRKNPSSGAYRFAYCPSNLICNFLMIYEGYEDQVKRFALESELDSPIWFWKA